MSAPPGLCMTLCKHIKRSHPPFLLIKASIMAATRCRAESSVMQGHLPAQWQMVYLALQ